MRNGALRQETASARVMRTEYRGIARHTAVARRLIRQSGLARLRRPEYAARFATRRAPTVHLYPRNEPSVTAGFWGRSGLWPPTGAAPEATSSLQWRSSGDQSHRRGRARRGTSSDRERWRRSPAYGWLGQNGASDGDRATFRAGPARLDIIGVNFYPHLACFVATDRSAEAGEAVAALRTTSRRL